MPAPPTNPAYELLLNTPGQLVFFLFTNDPDFDPETTIADFLEPTFPGYRRLNGAPLAKNRPDWILDAISRVGDFVWQRTEAGAAQTIKGWAVAYLDGNSDEQILAGSFFDEPFVLNSKDEFIKARIRLTVVQTPDPAEVYATVTFSAVRGQGVNPMQRFRGEELALLRKTLKTLEQVAKRDTALAGRGPRSRANPTPIIDPENAGLTAAFVTVKTRIQTLLAG